MLDRRRVQVQGLVQGVGFRPFVYSLARELHLCGWVLNSSQGVVIEVESDPLRLDNFITRLQTELPPHAAIHHLDWQHIAPVGEPEFVIRHSDDGGSKTALLLPDMATCPECLDEIFNPTNRRYRYPFTNCTHCGPRFTIIQGLPYDRPNTSMSAFRMCDACRTEYEDPLDRRFHAQPNACPQCGPQLALWNQQGAVLALHNEALLAGEEAIRQGKVVAIKGIGGFHLMVDARNDEAVLRLRKLKHRYEKPLAVMFPTLEQVKAACIVSDLEVQHLRSSEAPIVLLEREGDTLSVHIAPHNPYLGVMLPYSPLHHLLMHDLGFPVVATSGNLSGEPICTDEHEALERLRGIADLFLVHNRPIVRHVDDSIVREVAGRELILRRARGYAPLPIELPQLAPVLVAAGAHMKNAAVVTVGRQAFMSQHIGDMDSIQAYAAYTRVIHDFQQLYDLQPSAVACDLHPDYRSTQYAESLGIPIVRVQHHHAHVLSCVAEHHLEAPVLGVAWDGTGWGTDGTVWGGEFLLTDDKTFDRVSHLMTFQLPGGEQAVKEPRRSALGLVYAVYGDDMPLDLPPLQSFSTSERTLLMTALKRGVNAPITSSAGRLFDAVAALIGLRQYASFEGQAAMDLEFAQAGIITDKCYPFAVTDSTTESGMSRRILDLKPMVRAIVDDTHAGVLVNEIAAAFHNTLTEMIITVARLVDEHKVVLTGGCFQNKTLLEHTIDRLRIEGFEPYWHQIIPPNDGGIALGQVMAALKEQAVCV